MIYIFSWCSVMQLNSIAGELLYNRWLTRKSFYCAQYNSRVNFFFLLLNTFIVTHMGSGSAYRLQQTCLKYSISKITLVHQNKSEMALCVKTLHPRFQHHSDLKTITRRAEVLKETGAIANNKHGFVRVMGRLACWRRNQSGKATDGWTLFGQSGKFQLVT